MAVPFANNAHECDVARRDRDRVREAAHPDRCRRVGRGAVPQLAPVVEAPALGGPVRQQRTRMKAAGRDRDRVGEAAHHHRSRRVDQGAVPQLTVAVGAPTFGGAVRQQRTRMNAAGRDRHCVVQAADYDRSRRVDQGAVPQLTVAVGAPAFGGPVRQQRTRMGAARRDRGLDRPRARTMSDCPGRSDLVHQPRRHQRQGHCDAHSVACHNPAPDPARPDRSYHAGPGNTTGGRLATTRG